MSFKIAVKTAPFYGGTLAAQNFMFGTNTSDNTAGIYETNSPTNIHPNRRYQMLVSGTEMHFRAKRLFADTQGVKDAAISNARFMWIDQTTGEMKVSRMDSMMKMLRNTLTLPYTSITSTPTVLAQFNPIPGASTGTTGTYPNITFNNTAPDQVVTLTATNGLTVTGTYPNFTVTKKRQETYTGTTNASGVVTFTFAAFSAVPNIQPAAGFGNTNKETMIPNAAPTTTSCSYYVQLRADVLGLLPSYSNVSGREVNVLITEK
jgi:hypothetical protein